MRALIAGGSLGGLYAALALREVGWEVEVFERSGVDPSGRGGGIVMQPETEWFLERFGSSAREVSVLLHRRRFLSATGAAQTMPAPQLMTSWDRLYEKLRGALPDAHYHLGAAVTKSEAREEAVKITLTDGQTATGELLVCADGIRSTGRRQLLPTVAPAYGGYLAWRGLVSERDLPEDLLERLRDTFTFFSPPGTQFLCHFVPGTGGELEVGRRRLNWVWYVNVAHADLRRTLGTGAEVPLEEDVPPGQVPPAVTEQLRELAAVSLPQLLSHVVARTERPFVQAIFDLEVPRMVFNHACLLGDAAFVVRPHTAAGTSKAAGDALALAQALSGAGDVAAALRGWERQRLQNGQALVRHGQILARQSQLGDSESTRSPMKRAT